MRTILLLIASNIFMTIAWYGHLKFKGIPLWKAIVASWAIALLEYCLTVPANRIGEGDGWTLFQLKITQEVISLIIFALFAVLVFKEPFKLNYIISFAFILGAVYFAFKK